MKSNIIPKKSLIAAAVVLLLPAALLLAGDDDDVRPFLPPQVRAVSTVPANGDLNPYGVAFVPAQFPMGGTINPGDILVSNFNDSANLQGTGTTIVRIPANAPPSVFFQGPPPPSLGLTTALNVLRGGFVLVGNFPSTDGTCATAQAGSILVINSSGSQVSTITDPSINGPWDSALFDQGSTAQFYVANALSGTIVRFNLTVSSSGVSVTSATQIASGYKHQCDAVTFVDTPTGLVYNPKTDVLFVASAVDNAVFAISEASERNKGAGVGKLIYQDATHLHGPLGMVRAPNGHLLVANNDVINSDPNQPSEIVEFTTEGEFVKQISVDPLQGGSFGLAVTASGDVAQLAAVDDNTASLIIWTLELP